MTGIRIDELNQTAAPSLEHEFAAMKDSETVKLTVRQVAEKTLELNDEIINSSKGLLYFKDRGSVEDADIPNEVSKIETFAFDSSVHLGKGGATYRRASSGEIANYPISASLTSNDGAEWIIDEPFLTFEKFGAIGSGDEYQPIQDACDVGGMIYVGTVLGDVTYRSSKSIKIRKSVDLIGLNKNNKIVIENSNSEEGFHILHSDVNFRNFTGSVFTDSGIINGSGDKGTNVTISKWFVDPSLPEPENVKNITFCDMIFMRESGSKAGHSIAIMCRSSHVRVINTDFIGAGNISASGSQATAILTHWGAWTHGVSTTGVDFVSGNSVIFTDGATVTGNTSGATAYIVKVDGDSVSGTLRLREVSGTFQDGEGISDGLGAVALTDGLQYPSTVQSRFEPGRYSYHPNNITVKNITCRNVSRVMALSASFAVDVDGVDYLGPVQGGQLFDLPIGDEGDTYAHPDEVGRVYDGFSFRNVRGKSITGGGSHAVTVIDISGFSVSKQTGDDLAGYDDSEYTTEHYAGREHRKLRQFEWKNVLFENFTWDAGPADPPSATSYERQIFIRNLKGNVSFKNIYAQGRGDNADGRAVLSLKMDNVVGRYTFENCKFRGGVELVRARNVSFTDCEILHPEIGDSPNDTFAVNLTGSNFNLTSENAVTSVGATEIVLASGSSDRGCIGQTISYDGGVVYISEWLEVGDTVVKTTPLPSDVSSDATLTVNQFGQDISFTSCDVVGGDEGFDVENCKVDITGGRIRGTGQYGLLVNDGAHVKMSRTAFSNNGLRGLIDTLSTRDLSVNAGKFFGEGLIFEDSDSINHNVICAGDAESFSLTNSIFKSDPITNHYSITSPLSNGEPVVFNNNFNGDGEAVLYSDEWSPVIEIDGDSTGIVQTVNASSFSVWNDRVDLDFDVTLTSKGSNTGSLTITGLPFPHVNSSIGSVILLNANGLSGGGLVLRQTGGILRLYEQTASSVSSVKDSDITDTTRFIGSITYQRG